MNQQLIDDIRAISVIERILFLQRMLKDAEQERAENGRENKTAGAAGQNSKD
jgi:hypothetical protein